MSEGGGKSQRKTARHLDFYIKRDNGLPYKALSLTMEKTTTIKNTGMGASKEGLDYVFRCERAKREILETKERRQGSEDGETEAGWPKLLRKGAR
jgi:hypothetical protein